MASHAALASSRIPANTSRLPSKSSHSFPTQCFSKKLEVAEFSGLRSSSCMTFSKNGRETSFFDVVAAQLTPMTCGSAPVKGQTVAKLKVAINGFGRIGRNFLRCWHGRKDSPLDVIVVNDSGGVRNASHLLKYDSMLGTFKADVKIVDDSTISVDGKNIMVVSNRDPLKLPWAELGIDIVIEGTGVFVDGPGAGKHIQAGAKKVIITAPAKGADIPTYVMGVNEQDYSDEVANIISNASCTTNCLAPFVKVLDEEFGIVKGTMTTTHSYTGDQRLLDASHRDLRRARAAALNIVPTSTGAAKAVSLVLPQLKGKLNGIALRVPTPNVSVVDLVINVEKKGISAEDVNAAFRKAAEGPLKGILDVCVQNPGEDIRTLGCVYGPRHVSAILALTSALTGSHRIPITPYIMHLIELTQKRRTNVSYHELQEDELSDDEDYGGNDVVEINDAVDAFHTDTKVFVRLIKAVSSFATLYEDVCSAAEDLRASIILAPFHKHQRIDGKMESGKEGVRTTNQKILRHAPCSVGIIVERGLAGVPGFSQLLDSTTVQQVATLFFGGPDDREAIAWSKRIASHQKINLTVIRFLSFESSRSRSERLDDRDDVVVFMSLASLETGKDIDNAFLSDFYNECVTSGQVGYVEKYVSNGGETVAALKDIGDMYSLFIVGKGGRGHSPLTTGMSDWEECPELGTVGDLLASSEYNVNGSVLVVQQHKSFQEGSYG